MSVGSPDADVAGHRITLSRAIGIGRNLLLRANAQDPTLIMKLIDVARAFFCRIVGISVYKNQAFVRWSDRPLTRGRCVGTDEAPTLGVQRLLTGDTSLLG